MARSYVFDGQLEKAYEGYRECYAEFPSADRGIFCKYQAGNTALRKLSYPTAIQEYREFLSAHPTHRRANRTYYNLADSYRWWGKDGEAEKTALRALEKFKGAAGRQFHYYLTRLYVEQKRFAEALHQLSYLDKLSSRSLPLRGHARRDSILQGDLSDSNRTEGNRSGCLSLRKRGAPELLRLSMPGSSGRKGRGRLL